MEESTVNRAENSPISMASAYHTVAKTTVLNPLKQELCYQQNNKNLFKTCPFCVWIRYIQSAGGKQEKEIKHSDTKAKTGRYDQRGEMLREQVHTCQHQQQSYKYHQQQHLITFITDTAIRSSTQFSHITLKLHTPTPAKFKYT